MRRRVRKSRQKEAAENVRPHAILGDRRQRPDQRNVLRAAILAVLRPHGQHVIPIGSYKTAWRTARKKAGLAEKIFHDFRRTAATNLRRAGVPEEVAMKITGHVTNTMFKRYRIVDTGDVTRALEQRAAYETTKLAATPAASARLQ